MVNNNKNKPKNGRKARKQPSRKSNGSSFPRNPLLPQGVNNLATTPKATQSYTYKQMEVVANIVAPSDAAVGTILFDQNISLKSVLRGGLASNLFLRVDWLSAVLKLVTLNGSLVTSGYTMAFIEDPEIKLPTNKEDVIPFLTSLRGVTVRQNWVQADTGSLVRLKDMPEMYTQLGSDIRRFSPGRLVIALAGAPGPNTTFQLMMDYHVHLYVPCAITSANPEPPPPPPPTGLFSLNQPIVGPPFLPRDLNNNPFASTTAAVPNVMGDYLCVNDRNERITLARDVNVGGATESLTGIYIVGFRVINPEGGANDWTNRTVLLVAPSPTAPTFEPLPWFAKFGALGGEEPIPTNHYWPYISLGTIDAENSEYGNSIMFDTGTLFRPPHA